MARALPLLVAAAAGIARASVLAPEFDPASLTQSVAKCNAINRANETTIELDIHYVHLNPSNAPRTLVFVHGWPGLWSTWSNQISAFSSTYGVIALDLPGFGNSTHPGDFRASGQMRDLAADVRCVVQRALGPEGQAVCVGHDWGSQVCYEAARLYPDTFEGAAGTVPYIPPVDPFVPIAAFTKQVPTLTYQLYFDKKSDAAVAELNANVRKVLRASYKPAGFVRPPGLLESDSDYLNAYEGKDDLLGPVEWFNEKEEDYLVKAYEASGFDNTIQFYTTENRKGHHEWVAAQGAEVSIKQPTALIYPEADVVGDWGKLLHVLRSADFMPNLTVAKVPGSHWPQCEQPEPYNMALSAWLDMLPQSDKKWDDKTFVEKLTQIVIDDVNEDEPLPEAEEGAGPLIHEDL